MVLSKVLRGLLLLTIAVPVAAHETFVAPAGVAKAGAPIELRLSSTGHFPRTETAILPARIVALSASIGNAAQPLRATASRPTWLTLEARPATAGLLRVAVVLGPKSLALTPAKVDEYFADIEADQAVRDAYAALPAPRKWTETYTKHAKAFICVAPCPDASATMLPAGHALEFVAADTAMTGFVLMAKGKPLAAQPVQFIDAKGAVTRGLTDGDGRVDVPAAVARPLLLATTVLRVPVRSGGDFTSDFATLWVDK